MRHYRPLRAKRLPKIKGEVPLPTEHPIDWSGIRDGYQEYTPIRPMPEAREEPWYDSRFMPASEIAPDAEFSRPASESYPRPLTSPREMFDGRRVPPPPREPRPRLPTYEQGAMTPEMSERIIQQILDERRAEDAPLSELPRPWPNFNHPAHHSQPEHAAVEKPSDGESIFDPMYGPPYGMTSEPPATGVPTEPCEPKDRDEFSLASELFDQQMKLASTPFEATEPPPPAFPEIGGLEQRLLEPPGPPSLDPPTSIDPFATWGPLG